MTALLGIDIGGTVIKSGLYDGEGREKAVASEVDNGVAVRVGWSERNMHDMWRIVVKTIRRVVAESGVAVADIAGINFSAHGKGLYALDADGEPVASGKDEEGRKPARRTSAKKGTSHGPARSTEAAAPAETSGDAG